MSIPIPLGHQVPEWLAQDVVGPIAECCLGGGLEKSNFSITIGSNNGVRGRLYDRAEAPLALPQRLLRLLALPHLHLQLLVGHFELRSVRAAFGGFWLSR